MPTIWPQVQPASLTVPHQESVNAQERTERPRFLTEWWKAEQNNALFVVGCTPGSRQRRLAAMVSAIPQIHLSCRRTIESRGHFLRRLASLALIR